MDPIVGMLMSLDRNKSQNIFSCSIIKFLEVWECHLSYAYSTFHAANDVIAQPWRLDDQLGMERPR